MNDLWPETVAPLAALVGWCSLVLAIVFSPAPGARERALPNAALTPGAVRAGIGRDSVCTPGYAGRARDVPESEKRAVFREYGIPRADRNGRAYEIDHLVSLELGGSNAIGNLWPETRDRSFPYNAWRKDKLEDRLHALVCSGRLALAAAQADLRRDWPSAWRRYLGAAP